MSRRRKVVDAYDVAVDWLLNSPHTGDPDIQEPFWAFVDGLITRNQLGTFFSGAVRHRRAQLGLEDGYAVGGKIPSLRIVGHALPRAAVSAAGAGDAAIACECGAESPVLPSRAARRQWHYAHKRRVAAGQPEPPDDYFDWKDSLK